MSCKLSIRHCLPVFVILLCAGVLQSAATSASTAAPAHRLPSNAEVIISDLEGHEYRPAIAYNARYNEYLVVWETSQPNGGSSIYARRVAANGRRLAMFPVATGTNRQAHPSVAYDEDRERYLVVFSYDTNGDGSNWDIYGRFIDWNGPYPYLPDFPIWTSQHNEVIPVVAFSETQDEFLVTWTASTGANLSYISARRVFADGTGFPTSDQILLSIGAENRQNQDVTYNLARDEYLVTWDVPKAGSSLDIYGLRLSSTGSVLPGGNPAVAGEFPIAGWPAAEGWPAVTTCHQSDQYLVAWQSDQDSVFQSFAIYARYLDGDTVPGNVYKMKDTTYNQTSVDGICSPDGQKYLLAWQEFDAGGGFGIWARLATPGEVMDTAFELVGSQNAAGREHPAVGSGPNFLVAWEHIRDSGGNRDIHGRIVGEVSFREYYPLVVR